jgi:hypothetical protein
MNPPWNRKEQNMAEKTTHPDEMYFNEDHGILRQTVSGFVEKEINANLDDWKGA